MRKLFRAAGVFYLAVNIIDQLLRLSDKNWRAYYDARQALTKVYRGRIRNPTNTHTGKPMETTPESLLREAMFLTQVEGTSRERADAAR